MTKHKTRRNDIQNGNAALVVDSWASSRCGTPIHDKSKTTIQHGHQKRQGPIQNGRGQYKTTGPAQSRGGSTPTTSGQPPRSAPSTIQQGARGVPECSGTLSTRNDRSDGRCPPAASTEDAARMFNVRNRHSEYRVPNRTRMSTSATPATATGGRSTPTTFTRRCSVCRWALPVRWSVAQGRVG